jgi:putative SOS response-associated peptidase YedK
LSGGISGDTIEASRSHSSRASCHGAAPPGIAKPPAYPLNNARADKLGVWPWKAVQRQRCLIPASGFWEPEKPAREKGVAPWSYYSMQDERPFFMAGLWAEAHDPATGEVADSYM